MDRIMIRKRTLATICWNAGHKSQYRSSKVDTLGSGCPIGVAHDIADEGSRIFFDHVLAREVGGSTGFLGPSG